MSHARTPGSALSSIGLAPLAAGLALTALLAPLAGCVLPAVPPPLSVARFVKLPPGAGTAAAPAEADHGMVNASAGLAFVADDEGDGDLFSFVPEAALSLWPHHRYDITVAIDSYKATFEGNLVLLDEKVRLGILHGVGGGIVSPLNDQGGGVDPTFLVHLSAGVFAQFSTGPNAALFGAVRYAYATSDEADVVLPTHYLTFNAGWMYALGRLRITPELSVSKGISIDDDPMTPNFDFWLIVPGVTVSAGF